MTIIRRYGDDSARMTHRVIIKEVYKRATAAAAAAAIYLAYVKASACCCSSYLTHSTRS